MERLRRIALVLMTIAWCGACGGGRSGSPASPSPAPGGAATPTITITTAGVSPREITIDQGQRVLFVNQDTRDHNMASDPHPTHTDCPAINQVGFIRPGQQKETGNFTEPGTCGYHDHDRPESTALRGRIVIR
jgi:plastocyanin